MTFVESRVEDHNRRANEILVGERRNRAKELELKEQERELEAGKTELEAWKTEVEEQRSRNEARGRTLVKQAQENASERVRLERQGDELNAREDEIRRIEGVYNRGISEIADVLEGLEDQKSQEARRAREVLERRKRMPKAPAPKRPYDSAPKPNRGHDDDFQLG